MNSWAELTHALDALYSEPAPFQSAEEFARAHHEDIALLTLEEVDAERILARFRWAALVHHGVEPSPWLLDRIARLEQRAARLRRRGGEQR